jgi:hypothetical protein
MGIDSTEQSVHESRIIHRLNKGRYGYLYEFFRAMDDVIFKDNISI